MNTTWATAQDSEMVFHTCTNGGDDACEDSGRRNPLHFFKKSKKLQTIPKSS